MTELLYLDDAYMTAASAVVDEIVPEGLVLDRTIFYPGGGGQDCDTGALEVDGRSYDVSGVKRVSGKVVHLVDAVGIRTGDEVTLSLDWGRRHAMMKYHTALHLLVHCAHADFGATITGNQISPEKARIDLGLDELDADMTKRLVDETNRLIDDDLPVAIRTVAREEAERAVDPTKTRLDMLPASMRTVRLVDIGGFDLDACGGTHVRSTGEIGGIDAVRTINKGKGRKRMEIRLR
jgi:Ser-tRNA(Ala) deacylase AlaX